MTNATTPEPTVAGGTPAAGSGTGSGTQPAPVIPPAAGSAGPAGAMPAAGETPAAGSEPTDDLAGLRKALDAERKARVAAEKKLKDADDAKLSETDRLTKRNAEMERELLDRNRENQELRVGAAIEKAAAKAGFANPELAARLIDQAALTVDDAGSPTNVDQLVGSLAKSYPNLIAKAPAAGSGDLGLGGGRSATRTYTREQLRDATFFAANRDDILAAQREGRIQG